jgi:Fe/S biogenesis protein NfuA
MGNTNTNAGDSVVTLTDAALAKVLELRAGETSADTLALWVDISGTAGDSYTYDLYFQAAADADPSDWVNEHDSLTVVVPKESIDKMRGSVLDLSRSADEGGMVIQNPNHPAPLAASPAGPASPAMGDPPPDLSGDVAQRVIQVLEQSVNPAIAAHGGRADLVAIEEETAYLRLSGGCAGCGLATVTLSQGIEVAIRDNVPEITRIIDVTDHAAGTNPYYEPAKK